MAKQAKNEAVESNGKLGRAMVAMLEALAESKNGRYPRLSRAGIAEKCGYKSSVAVYQQVGWPDESKRKEWEKEHGRKTLLTAGYVREMEVEDDGHKETVVEITASGRKALESAQKAAAAAPAKEKKTAAKQGKKAPAKKGKKTPKTPAAPASPEPAPQTA